MTKHQIELSGNLTPTGGVTTKVNRVIWQAWGLLFIGVFCLVAAITLHAHLYGLDSLIAWIDENNIIGSIGIELLGAGLVLIVVARIAKIYR